jgi:hypothetical protein
MVGDDLLEVGQAAAGLIDLRSADMACSATAGSVISDTSAGSTSGDFRNHHCEPTIICRISITPEIHADTDEEARRDA